MIKILRAEKYAILQGILVPSQASPDIGAKAQFWFTIIEGIFGFFILTDTDGFHQALESGNKEINALDRETHKLVNQFLCIKFSQRLAT